MEFFLSPGFGGAAVLVAAVVAYAAARWRGRVDQRLGESEAWWIRTRWALDLTCHRKPYNRTLGWNALAILVDTAPTDEDADIVRNAARASEEVQVPHPQWRRFRRRGVR